MTPETIMTIGRHALEITMLLAAPLLLAALVIGLLVGVFQAATQINEMTLSFIPKLIGMADAPFSRASSGISTLASPVPRHPVSVIGTVRGAVRWKAAK